MERIDLAQSLLVDDKGRVLLVLNRNGEWQFPGGRRDAGDTLREAAIRGTELQVGVTVEVERVAAIGEFLTRLSDVHNLIVLFAVRTVEGVPELQPDQNLLELKWATPDEADWLVPFHPGGVGRLTESTETLYYALEGFE